MKNRVNLYHPDYHPKLRLLSLSIVLLIWLFVIIACSVLYVYGSSNLQDLEAEVVKLEQNQTQQKLLVDELQSAVANQQVDPLLLKQVEKNQRLVGLKKRVLNKLTGQEELKSGGYADLMLDLANHGQSGLWLTHINLNGTSVSMGGATTDSATVPKWLSLLGQTAYFKGQEFADTRLYRDAEQQLNFVVSTGKELTTEQGPANE